VTPGARTPLAAPLARPPARQNFTTRWQAECRAGVVYLVWAGVSLWMAYIDVEHAFIAGAMAAYGAAALMMLAMAGTSSAWIIARERDRGTMEALVLTPGRHEEIARGRFWYVARPWGRFLLWLLPLYIVQAVMIGGAVNTSNTVEFVMRSALCAFGPKGAMAGVMAEGMSRSVEIPCWAILLTVGRIVTDAVDLLAAVSIGYYASARFWRTSHAVLVAGLVVPAAMLSVFCAPEWMLVLTKLVEQLIGGAGGMRGGFVATAYCVASVVTMAFEIALARWLVKRVVSRFDSYALGAVEGV
jgi:hypothetical protein